MSHDNAVVGIYEKHTDAEEAVKRLDRSSWSIYPPNIQ